jgi:thiamine transport system substrate-binding protein
MKSIFVFFVALFFGFAGFAKELTVYTYSSFASEWGPGPKIFPLFEKQCSCKLKVVGLQDTGQLLARAILEQENPKADILLGLNDTHLAKLKNLNIFSSYQGKNYKKLPKNLQLDPKQRFIPFDYGHIAFIYDSQKIKNPPKSLEDLTHPRFKGKIVIESASTSAPGLSFLYWTIQKYNEQGFLDYWRKLSDNILSIPSSWSTAYGMFTSGETPIVLSYVTSSAYHKIVESSDRYQAAIFSEGHYPQIEFAAIIKKNKSLELSEKFIDFLLSESAQNIIPTSNWMYPAIVYKPLEKGFIPPSSIKTLPLLEEVDPQKSKQWIRLWSAEIRRR